MITQPPFFALAPVTLVADRFLRSIFSSILSFSASINASISLIFAAAASYSANAISYFDKKGSFSKLTKISPFLLVCSKPQEHF